MSAKIETGNMQLVAVRGPWVVVMLPKVQMTPDEALLHAAWLVTMANINGLSDGRRRFIEMLDAVGST